MIITYMELKDQLEIDLLEWGLSYIEIDIFIELCAEELQLVMHNTYLDYIKKELNT